MRQLIVGNWKMNGGLEAAGIMAAELAAAAPALDCDLVVCPPFTLIYPLVQALAAAPIAVGAQDCHQATTGAFTGEVSAPMLADVGARYVIVGHSERREYQQETSALVRSKTEAVLLAGLIPLICVGESEKQRRAGFEMETVGKQLAESLPDNFVGVVSYEPIWAIGTGLTARPADVASMHDFIRERLVARFGDNGARTRLLYGGSVKPGNAAELLAIGSVNGALVGGASLVAADFLGIARAARKG
jgi:triosephosphate isomerase